MSSMMMKLLAVAIVLMAFSDSLVRRASGLDSAGSILASQKRPSQEILQLSKGTRVIEKKIESIELKELGPVRPGLPAVRPTSAQKKVIEAELKKEITSAPLCLLLDIIHDSPGDFFDEDSGVCIPPGTGSFSCGKSKYRTIDGTCNNLANPKFGSTIIPYKRHVKPAYDDGLNKPRTMAEDDSQLPHARVVSLNVTPVISNKADRKLSIMAMRWGQFLDHDITLTPDAEAGGYGGHGASPCRSDGNLFPLPVPVDDPFFISRRGSCIEFTRSFGTFFDLGGAIRRRVQPREQVNELTAYIDASNIYGSSERVAKELREPSTARLRTSASGADNLLPQTNRTFGGCLTRATSCFLAGDLRVNENVGLTSMHTIWVRIHNQIAPHLKWRNPNWSIEKTFQETRRIIGALHQHITTNEFLPKILNSATIHKYDLQPSSGHIRTYNRFCDARITNVFATAAYRFGHSLIGDHMFAVFPGQSEQKVSLVDKFANPSDLANKHYVEAYLTGDSYNPAQRVDRFFTDAVHNRLFEVHEQSHDGLDLIALNVQRGRDHGLAPYVSYLRYCNIPVPRSFDGLSNLMDSETINRLKDVYRSVNDIDVFVGIVAERHMPGANLGPLGSCLIGEQFGRLKKCDRFWYENAGEDGSFTADQLREIKKMTLAKVICDASSLPDMEIRDDVFLTSGRKLRCDEISGMDLTPWRQSRTAIDILDDILNE